MHVGSVCSEIMCVEALFPLFWILFNVLFYLLKTGEGGGEYFQTIGKGKNPTDLLAA